jgi:hypothetical protein
MLSDHDPLLRRPELHPIPARMRGRPIDHRGYPVPWFVTEKTADGLWDFTVVDKRRRDEAIRRRVCWVSGEPLGRYVAFVLGPMCTINRVSSDPPVIPEIAEWSARVCPFLSRPLARRPHFTGQGSTPGLMVPDNPGLCAVWTTKDYYCGRDGLFALGDPEVVSWWQRGQRVDDSAEARLVYEDRAARLEAMAAEEGPAALALFRRMKRRVDLWAPASVAVLPNARRTEDAT